MGGSYTAAEMLSTSEKAEGGEDCELGSPKSDATLTATAANSVEGKSGKEVEEKESVSATRASGRAWGEERILMRCGGGVSVVGERERKGSEGRLF